MKFSLLKIGTDAEMFLRSKIDQQPVPVVGLLGGTKTSPMPMIGMAPGFAVQEDNVMAEFNIPAAPDARKFSDSIFAAMGYVAERMKAHDLVVCVEPSMFFPETSLDTAQAQEFGCEPDFNAWTKRKNKVDRENVVHTLRTAAAHIHVSYTVDGSLPNHNLKAAELGVKAMDLFLGVPSIFADKDTNRRKLYGKAGAFRPKSYGHEYRTISNFWIARDKQRRWAFEQTAAALEFASSEEGKHALLKDEATIEMIQDAINDNDEAIAEHLVMQYNLEVPVYA